LGDAWVLFGHILAMGVVLLAKYCEIVFTTKSNDS